MAVIKGGASYTHDKIMSFFSMNAHTSTTNTKYTKIFLTFDVCGIFRRVFFASSTLAMRMQMVSF